MAGTSALGGFVEGLQGGMKFREDSRRNKLVDQALGRKVAALDRAEIADLEMLKAENIDTTDYTRGADVFGQDPYGEKLGVWGTMKQNFQQSPMGQMIARARNKGTEQTKPEMEEGVPKAVPGMGQSQPQPRPYGPMMADGGQVGRSPRPSLFDEEGNRRALTPDELKERSYGAYTEEGDWIDRYVTDAEHEVLQRRNDDYARANSFAGKRAAVEAPRGLVADRRAPLVNYDWEAADFGRAISNFDLLRPILGDPDEDKKAAIAASDVAAQPGGEYPVPDDFDPNMKLYPDGAPGQAGPGQTGPAQAGPEIQSRRAVAPKSNPVTWADVEAAPEDVPRMATKDWEEYRKSAVKAAIYRGGTAKDGHDMVTNMQMEGFQNHAMQAFQLLQSGNWKQASLALTAAYQYFPNGADIKFGMAKDKQGQPALVAMGTDEKTGEPVGNPMLINQERLAMMVEHMSDPSTFRQWTKDWRNEEFERQIFEEYTKPIGEANAETARINARANEANAAARGQEAINARGRGGMTQAQYNTALKYVEEGMANRGLMQGIEPEDQGYLTQVAAIVYMQDPSNWVATVEEVMRLYRQGGVEAVDTAFRRGE